MKIAVLVVMLLTLGAVAAEAQLPSVSVDILCRVVSADVTTTMTSQTFGTPADATYWNCNQPMPYIPPSRWLCVTSVRASMYQVGATSVAGAGVYGLFNHDKEGHDYHGVTFPPGLESLAPMAFPPNDPTALTIINGRHEPIYTRVRVAGYLGRDISATRETACQ